MVDLGESGLAILSAWRHMDKMTKAVQRQVAHDLIAHGRSIVRTDMGEGCTPIFTRIDPNDFYAQPERQSDEQC